MNVKKIKNYIKKPIKIVIGLDNHKIIHLSDTTKIKLEYKDKFGKKLNLNNPKTFNEKLQWLKLNDRKSKYTQMVDKYEAKKYVSNIIGEEYIIHTIGIYDKFDDIDFTKLPNQFVIKCTHDSGGIVICKDKTKLDIKSAKKKINYYLKRNYYNIHREWPYKNVKPRIIIEEYMVDESGTELKDYKFFCFSGEPKFLFIAKDRPHNTKFNFYDLEFNKLPFKQHYDNFIEDIIKPQGFDKMIKLAKELSKGIPYIRVDFYDVNGKIYFGELTFYHFSGLERFEPEEFDEKIGEWLIIDKN